MSAVAPTPLTRRPGFGERLRRAAWFVVPLAAVLLFAGWRARERAEANRHFADGQVALRLDDPAAARAHFAACLAYRPYDAATHFYAARAARKDGEFADAAKHLDVAAAGYDPEAVAVERSLTRAQQGGFEAEEPYLVGLLARRHPESAAICDILARWYFRQLYLNEASTCVKLWLELEPESPTAWVLQAEISVRYNKRDGVIDAYRQAARLRPGHRPTRLALAAALLESNRVPGEVMGILEGLLKEQPADPVTLAQLGEAHENGGDIATAKSYYDRAIALAPTDASALFLRGRLELEQGQAGAAVGFLSRALEASAGEPEQILYSYFRALSVTGPPELAKATEARWKRCNDDLKALFETTRLIAGRPLDPELRRQAGEICLRNRREADGVRWLESALKLQPDHAATRKTLAEHYRKVGDTAKATLHEAQSSPRSGMD